MGECEEMDIYWEGLESKTLTLSNSQNLDSNQVKLRLINNISLNIYKTILILLNPRFKVIT